MQKRNSSDEEVYLKVMNQLSRHSSLLPESLSTGSCPRGGGQILAGLGAVE